MIKANEAVVGRIFNRELRTQRGLEYDHEFVLTGEWMGKLFGNDISISLGDLFPIPLSPELLERAGFDYDASYQIPKVQRKNFILFDGGDCVLSANFGHIEQLDVEIKYVHQLQNLYFALTGEELTFKIDPSGKQEE